MKLGIIAILSVLVSQQFRLAAKRCLWGQLCSQLLTIVSTGRCLHLSCPIIRHCVSILHALFLVAVGSLDLCF